MELIVLVDNTAIIDRTLPAEAGLSLFLRDGDQTVLFDLGYSDLFARNARSMGLDPLQAGHVVLSHGHLDHSWGLDALVRLHVEALAEGQPRQHPVLLTHPGAFASRRDGVLPEIGCLLPPDRLDRFFTLRTSRDPVQLTRRLFFLGEIPRRFGFEAGRELGLTGSGESAVPDPVEDDTALAFVSDRGLVVMTGCAHSGICNTVEHAREVCGCSRVADILGGLHLMDARAETLAATGAYLRGLDLEALHACHCTDLAAKIALAGYAPLAEVGSGLRLCYPPA